MCSVIIPVFFFHPSGQRYFIEIIMQNLISAEFILPESSFMDYSERNSEFSSGRAPTIVEATLIIPPFFTVP